MTHDTSRWMNDKYYTYVHVVNETYIRIRQAVRRPVALESSRVGRRHLRRNLNCSFAALLAHRHSSLGLTSLLSLSYVFSRSQSIRPNHNSQPAMMIGTNSLAACLLMALASMSHSFVVPSAPHHVPRRAHLGSALNDAAASDAIELVGAAEQAADSSADSTFGSC